MKSLAFAFVAITVTAGLLPAQGRGSSSGDIPPGHRPPPGMCRVWIDGVPPGRQPAPTRCDDAFRNRPSNARVIRGSDSRDDGRWERDGRSDRDDDRWERDDDDDDRWGDRDDRKSKGKYKGKAKHQRADRRQAADVCLDRDRDGWCDWRERRDAVRHERRTSDRCLDRNHDGRCDDAVVRRTTNRSIIEAVLGKH